MPHQYGSLFGRAKLSYLREKSGFLGVRYSNSFDSTATTSSPNSIQTSRFGPVTSSKILSLCSNSTLDAPSLPNSLSLLGFTLNGAKQFTARAHDEWTAQNFVRNSLPSPLRRSSSTVVRLTPTSKFS